MSSPHPQSEYAPGSINAIEHGCSCPVLDNGHGAGRGDGLFWINSDCPLHGDESEPDYPATEREGIEAGL